MSRKSHVIRYLLTHQLSVCNILYFRIPHNTLCLPPKFCINYCFQMTWGLGDTAYSQEHLKTMVHAKFRGQTKCIMGNSKIENSRHPLFPNVYFHPSVAPWWEHSPPTNVAWVLFPASAPYVGWVCLFSTLRREVFPRVFRFSPLLKN